MDGCVVSAYIEYGQGLDAHGERKYHQINGEVRARVVTLRFNKRTARFQLEKGKVRAMTAPRFTQG